MSVLSTRVLNMKESATLAMARKSRELKEQGVDIINLSLGEPDFDTPDNIKAACKQALDKGDTKYTMYQEQRHCVKPFVENLKEKTI